MKMAARYMCDTTGCLCMWLGGEVVFESGCGGEASDSAPQAARAQWRMFKIPSGKLGPV